MACGVSKKMRVVTNWATAVIIKTTISFLICGSTRLEGLLHPLYAARSFLLLLLHPLTVSNKSESAAALGSRDAAERGTFHDEGRASH